VVGLSLFRDDEHFRDMPRVIQFVMRADADKIEGVVAGAFTAFREWCHGIDRAQCSPVGMGDGEVLALNVGDDGRFLPGEQVRNHTPHALAAACRREGEQVAVAAVAHHAPMGAAEQNAARLKEPSGSKFVHRRKARRAMAEFVRKEPQANARSGPPRQVPREAEQHPHNKAMMHWPSKSQIPNRRGNKRQMPPHTGNQKDQ